MLTLENPGVGPGALLQLGAVEGQGGHVVFEAVGVAILIHVSSEAAVCLAVRVSSVVLLLANRFVGPSIITTGYLACLPPAGLLHIGFGRRARRVAPPVAHQLPDAELVEAGHHAPLASYMPEWQGGHVVFEAVGVTILIHVSSEAGARVGRGCQ